MAINWLTPLERTDYRRLIGPRALDWGEAWFWVLTIAISFRLFVVLPETLWHRIGLWSVLLGAYIAFLSAPYLAYQLVARRVREGTFQIERTLPLEPWELLWSKLKVCAMVVLRWSGPCFLLGWIADPAFEFTRTYIAAGLYQAALYLPEHLPFGVVLLALAVLFYGGLWLLSTIFLLRLALRGRSLLELAGQQLFWLGAIFLALAWAEPGLAHHPVAPVATGYLGLVVVVVAIIFGLALVLFNSASRRLGTFR